MDVPKIIYPTVFAFFAAGFMLGRDNFGDTQTLIAGAVFLLSVLVTGIIKRWG